MKAIFLDLETTGLDPRRHAPIDLALKVVDLKTGATEGVYQSLIKLSREAWACGDPASIAINGYTWEELQNGKELGQIEQEVIGLFSDSEIIRGKSMFICQNPGFDRAFFAQIVPAYTQEKLNWPYHWLDLASMFWATSILKMHENGLPVPEAMNLSKNAIAKEFGLPPEEKPHKAINGVNHLILCYRAVMTVNW